MDVFRIDLKGLPSAFPTFGPVRKPTRYDGGRPDYTTKKILLRVYVPSLPTLWGRLHGSYVSLPLTVHRLKQATYSSTRKSQTFDEIVSLTMHDPEWRLKVVPAMLTRGSIYVANLLVYLRHLRLWLDRTRVALVESTAVLHVHGAPCPTSTARVVQTLV